MVLSSSAFAEEDAVVLPGAPEPETPLCAGTPEKDKSITATKVRQGDSLWKLMRRLGVSGGDIERLARDFRPMTRLQALQPGERFRVKRNREGKVEWLRYRLSTTIAYCGLRESDNTFDVSRLDLPLEKKLTTISGDLENGWEAALKSHGEPESLATLLSGLIELPEDKKIVPKYKVVIEKRMVDGDFLGYGPIQAVQLQFAETTTQAFYFAAADGTAAYYDINGKPIVRRSLRPPVIGAALTSGFGRRWHPIRRRYRPHKGVDYGAPQGTPVYAVESGEIDFAAYRRALGRMVVLKHRGNLTTRYAHLRRFAKGIKKGKSVEEGQIIGYVGSTGMSTGPHLHFETILNGRHVDPQKLTPPAPPELSEEQQKAFKLKVTELLSLLGGLVG